MIELAEIGRSLAILLLVLGLILAIAWGLRRFNFGALASSQAPRRLGIVESLSLDPRTRLVLVRHDDREHLLIVGAQGATPIPGLSSKDIASPEVVR